GWAADYGRETWTSDPSIDAIVGPYTAALNHYVRAELGYSSDLPYEILTDRVRPWSYKEFEGVHVHVLEKLSEAMRTNPHMRVHVDCGYHDLATPSFAADPSFSHLAIPAELAANIDYSYYEAGHMMYLHEPSRLAQAEQLAQFVQQQRGAWRREPFPGGKGSPCSTALRLASMSSCVLNGFGASPRSSAQP